MGGNAIKGYETKRLDKVDFLASFKNVSGVLSKKDFGLKLDMVPAYKEKKDFGDLDIIVSKESFESYVERNLKSDANDEEKKQHFLNSVFSENFNCREVFHNEPVISFEYRKSAQEEAGFQVDLILIPNKFYDFALNYFSYNDLGNLLGVMFRNLGVKFGIYGISKEVYIAETNKQGEMLVTNCFDDALDILKLDKHKFHEGFNNLNEIFEYIVSSPYFNKEIYALDQENNNYKSRRRNAKRGTYSSFLEWIKDRDFENNYNHKISQQEKEENLNVILGGNFKEMYDEHIRNILKERKNNEKISGERITEWTGLTKQALGMLVSEFKNQFKSQEEINDYLKNNVEDKIKNDIVSLKNKMDFTGVIGDPITNPSNMSHKRIKTKKMR